MTEDTSPRSLIAQWREYQATSQEEARKAHRVGDVPELASRKAEACTLNVCASDLEAALAAQDAKLADLEAELRRFAEGQRKLLAQWREDIRAEVAEIDDLYKDDARRQAIVAAASLVAQAAEVTLETEAEAWGQALAWAARLKAMQG